MEFVFAERRDVPENLEFIKALAEYKSMGAEPMEDWTVYRIAGERLQELGSR